MSSNDLCKACTLLEGLERGMASSGIVRRSSLYVPTLCLRSAFRPTEGASSLKQVVLRQRIFALYPSSSLQQDMQQSPSKRLHNNRRDLYIIRLAVASYFVLCSLDVRSLLPPLPSSRCLSLHFFFVAFLSIYHVVEREIHVTNASRGSDVMT